MNQLLPVLIVALLTLTACGQKEPVEPVLVTEPEVVVETVPEMPIFNVDIDEDDAFEAALGELGEEDIPTFVEVIDDIDADSIEGADPAAKLAEAIALDPAAYAESEARGVAREALQAITEPIGLEIRPYSEDLFVQVKGVRPAVLYFTAQDCETCQTWETGLRAEAEAFTDINALILLADFETESDLAAEMRVTEPGYAMMLTGMGEMMGPRSSDRMTTDDLMFIFQ